MELTTGNGQLGLMIDLGEPSSSSAGSSNDAKKEARALVERALSLVGENDFAAVVETLGQERLRTAVARLMSDQWWQQTIKMAMVQPQQFNTQLLCKMIDKAVPTQQAVRQELEEGFKLVIETVQVAV